jgi:hypothetical protein
MPGSEAGLEKGCSVRFIKAFLASALSVLVMGAAAVSAQAVESEWMIGGEPLSELELEEEEELALSGTPLSLSVPSLKVVIKCNEVGGSGAILKDGIEEFAASLTECETTNAGKKLSSCKPFEPVVVNGKTELIEAGEALYAKVLPPKEGGPLTTISFGELCALGEEVQVKGSVAAEVDLAPSEEQVLTFSEAISNSVNEALEKEAQASLSLTFGASKKAFLNGDLSSKLSGASTGLEFQNAVRTRLCEERVQTCPAEKTHESGVSIRMANEVPIKFLYNTFTVKCTKSELAGATSQFFRAMSWKISTAFFSECATGVACPVSAIGQPYQAWLTRGGVFGDGFFAVGIDFPLKVEFKCENLKCVYEMYPWIAAITGGTPAKFSSGPMPMYRVKAASDGGCSENGTWEGEGGTTKYEMYVESAPSAAVHVTS